MGIIGEYGFSFTKVNEIGDVLSGVMFSLYISDDFSIGADRFVYSNDDGIVIFKNLPEGIYYLQETAVPYGYILDGTIYKVVLIKQWFEIYYGDNFENKISDHDNKITNRSEFDVQPVFVTLTGRKKFIGKTLESGMFNFIVKDDAGTIVATGTNNANGIINCSEIKIDAPGVYIFTVEEVPGSYSGITYDGSKFTVTVTVMDDKNGNLIVEVSYPDGGVIFNNEYVTTHKNICQCYKPTKCRKNIIGKVIWEDNNNIDNTRPTSVKIILRRDGEIYKTMTIYSDNNWTFAFCCLLKWNKSRHKYDYQIDEDVFDGYIKMIEGYNVINTLIQ